MLWDGAGEAELAWWRATAAAHLDPSLPLLDVGCGNGRLSRLFAGTFPSVLGIDLAAAAVEVARRESEGTPGLLFRQLDVTAPDAAEVLLAEFGPLNVVVRGVFHVMSPSDRRRAADTLARILAGSGSLLLLETKLAWGPARLPGASRRALRPAARRARPARRDPRAPAVGVRPAGARCHVPRNTLGDCGGRPGGDRPGAFARTGRRRHHPRLPRGAQDDARRNRARIRDQCS